MVSQLDSRYAPDLPSLEAISPGAFVKDYELTRVAPVPPPTHGWGGQPSEEEKVCPVPEAAEEGTQAPRNGACGCCRRELQRFLQQEESSIRLHLWIFRRRAQGCFAIIFALLFGVIGAFLLLSASSTFEKSIPYESGDTKAVFTIDEDLKNVVLISYEIPTVYVNQKRYVDNKEDFIFGNALNSYTCEDAGRGDVGWRRCPDASLASETCQHWHDCLMGGACPPSVMQDTLMRRMANLSSFKPCGLVALSMFTDRFELARVDDSGGVTVKIDLDESGLALPGDEKIFEDKVARVESSGHVQFQIKGRTSWLTEEDHLYEHFKVWFRQPASPHIRHLWATIPGGLTAGSYELRFLENGPQWTDVWGVEKKYVTISEAHVLGSPSACRFLGSICITFCAIQVVMALIFVVLPSFIGER